VRVRLSVRTGITVTILAGVIIIFFKFHDVTSSQADIIREVRHLFPVKKNSLAILLNSGVLNNREIAPPGNTNAQAIA